MLAVASLPEVERFFYLVGNRQEICGHIVSVVAATDRRCKVQGVGVEKEKGGPVPSGLLLRRIIGKDFPGRFAAEYFFEVIQFQPGHVGMIAKIQRARSGELDIGEQIPMVPRQQIIASKLTREDQPSDIGFGQAFHSVRRVPACSSEVHGCNDHPVSPNTSDR
jgi:hypothetical protein